MKSRSQSQAFIPPMEVHKAERHESAFRKQEQARAMVPEPEQESARVLAAELFDEVLRAANLESGEVAYLLGVSESLVNKMRSKDARGCPSLAQLLRLPPVFHLELHRAMNRRYGFGRAALGRLLEAAGDLAMGLE